MILLTISLLPEAVSRLWHKEEEATNELLKLRKQRLEFEKAKVVS